MSSALLALTAAVGSHCWLPLHRWWQRRAHGYGRLAMYLPVCAGRCCCVCLQEACKSSTALLYVLQLCGLCSHTVAWLQQVSGTVTADLFLIRNL